jgi:hypothetical protein
VASVPVRSAIAAANSVSATAFARMNSACRAGSSTISRTPSVHCWSDFDSPEEFWSRANRAIIAFSMASHSDSDAGRARSSSAMTLARSRCRAAIASPLLAK